MKVCDRHEFKANFKRLDWERKFVLIKYTIALKPKYTPQHLKADKDVVTKRNTCGWKNWNPVARQISQPYGY